MTIFKIPKVAIFIPGATSALKFEPEYVYPLYKRIHPKVADPVGNPLRIIPHPRDIKMYSAFWHEIEAETIEEAIQIEENTLRSQYGLDPKNGDPIFDNVYPSGSFAARFHAALESAETLASDPIRKDPADAIAEVCAEVGLDFKVARMLTATGFDSLDALILADIDQLARKIGKVRAAKLIHAANKKVDVLIDASVGEQIEGAKAKAKGK